MYRGNYGNGGRTTVKKFLVVGLGSMGKRRIRCLNALGVLSNDIYGMDKRMDRCKEAEEKYGIKIIYNENEIDFGEIYAVIVSLPPDRHFEGAKIALQHHKPVFVEASVVWDDVIKIKEGNKSKVFVAPSCTMTFHPAIKEIKHMIGSGQYGKVCNFSYHSGQYLPDWHPWENVNDFYVGNRLTGGAREIVPFELTWITDVFGYPKDIKGYFRKTTDIGCNIEDSYVCSLDYGDMVGSVLVDVVGRNALRNLVINFEYAQVQWRCDAENLEVYEVQTGKWKSIEMPDLIHEKGYDKSINENMYIDEINAFIKGISETSHYPNTIEKDIKVLELLTRMENSDGGFDRK